MPGVPATVGSTATTAVAAGSVYGLGARTHSQTALTPIATTAVTAIGLASRGNRPPITRGPIARPTLLRLFLVPGVVFVPVTYFALYHSGGQAFAWAIFACGFLVVGQFSYFGEYLPKVFPLHLRGTGGSFATNVGGRMLGTSAAFLTTNIIAPMIGAKTTFDQVAVAAGIVGTSVFVIALALTFLLPEPKEQSEV